MQTRIKTVTSAAGLLVLRFNEALAMTANAANGPDAAQAGGAAAQNADKTSGNPTVTILGFVVGVALIWLGYRLLTRGMPKIRSMGIAELEFDPADKTIRAKSVVEGVLVLLAGMLVIIAALWWAVG
jgi:hypothetical protein